MSDEKVEEFLKAVVRLLAVVCAGVGVGTWDAVPVAMASFLAIIAAPNHG